jgi:8-oxo-dGTP diphosphatase
MFSAEMAKFKTIKVAVDGIVLFKGKILFIKRKFEPFKGFWALPGGFVKPGEKVEDALKREIFEETGVKVKIIKILNAYSEPGRDPRGHVITLAYICKAKNNKISSSPEALEAKWFEKVPEKLAFDHSKILRDFLFSNFLE